MKKAISFKCDWEYFDYINKDRIELEVLKIVHGVCTNKLIFMVSKS